MPELLVPTDRPVAAIYGEQEAGRAAKVRKAVEDKIKGIMTSTFDIAELLFEIKSKHYYADWGYESFQEYVSTLQIKPRKAQYLVRMVEVMSAVEVERNTYEPIGLSKLREITSLDYEGDYTNPEDGAKTPYKDIIRGLVDRAGDMELGDIKKAVRILKGLTGEDELIWVNFSLKRSVKEEVLDPALKLAKLLIGDSGRDEEGMAIEASDGAALEIIAVEFLNENQPQIQEKVE